MTEDTASKSSRRRSRSNGATPTLKDVAEAVGVSAATVSLVLNAKSGARISEATRERVMTAVEELGYRPNALAKSLVHGQSKFVGIVAEGLATSPFAGSVIKGAQEEAWRRGFVLLIADTEDDPAATAEAIAMMHDHQAVGILYSTWHHRSVRPHPLLAGIPTVFVNCFPEGDPRAAVVPDEAQGACTAASLLLEAGHRRVVFINSTESVPSTVGRLAGFKEALSAAGIPFDPTMVEPIDPGEHADFAEAGFAAGLRILARSAPPTGVFCYNDRTAMGFYDAMRENNIRIPQDMAVVGFDDQEIIAAHLRPGLTTVALPHYELGARGVRHLLDLVSGSSDHSGIDRVPCPPVMRDSLTHHQLERA